MTGEQSRRSSWPTAWSRQHRPRMAEEGLSMIEVNGIAHVILTVSQWEKAHAFYSELLPFLGMTKVYDGNNFLYHVGGRTAIGIQRCAPAHAAERLLPDRGCLHHVCLRARSRNAAASA